MIRKYQQGGAVQGDDQEMQLFLQTLMLAPQLYKQVGGDDLSDDFIGAIAQVKEDPRLIEQVAQQYPEELEMCFNIFQENKESIIGQIQANQQMFKKGGKIDYFVNTFAKGGKCCKKACGGKTSKKENGGEVEMDKCGKKMKKCGCGCSNKTIKAQGGEQLPDIYNNGLEAAADAMPNAFKVMPLFNGGFYDYDKTMPIPKMVLSGKTDKQKQARKSAKRVPDLGYATHRRVGTSIPSVVPENAVWPHSVSNVVYENAVIGPKGKETSAVTYAIAGMPAIGDTLIDQKVGRDHHIIINGSPEYDTIMSRLREYFPKVQEEKKGGCIKRK